jgi:broad specificity phosphatase PhoE
MDKYHWTFPGGESYADADIRAGDALARIGRHPKRRPLVVSHEMIGRMLQRHLLGLDPHQVLTQTHPNDVIYQIDPNAIARHELR